MLINKNFQYRFVLCTFLPVLLIQIVLWLALEIYLNTMITKAQTAALPLDHFYYRLIDEQLKLLKILFVSVGAVGFFVTVIWGLFISHKIAGPFYRMTNMLNDNDPNLKTLKFRPGDFFPEVGDALARYVNEKKS